MSDGQILWTQEDVIKATQGSLNSDGNWTASGVSIDSRTIKPGEIFIALTGLNVNGHDYVQKAFENGAIAAIVEQAPDDVNEDANLVIVSDTLKAMEDLGHAARNRTRAKIIGITGSVGKTGTKEMLSIVLQAFGKTHASIRSYNNHWGVPLTLANLPEDADYGVFEMGMNNPGEMTKLSEQVRPDIAIITTIEPAHIGHFKSIEEIADAKAEIFTGITENGTAILNHDNPQYQRLLKAAKACGLDNILSFGEDEEADARLIDFKLHSDRSKGTANIMGEKVKYRLSIPGQHILINSLTVLLAVKALGLDLERAAETVRQSQPIEGRGTQKEILLSPGTAPLVLIDESYNASPAAMRAAFEVLKMSTPAQNGRRIAVLGDMLELGPEGPTLHAELANPLLHAGTDLVFTCGPLMEALYQVLPPPWQGGHAENSKDLAELVCDVVQPGDVVLVKGSLGSQMAYVVQALHDLCNQADSSNGERANAV